MSIAGLWVVFALTGAAPAPLIAEPIDPHTLLVPTPTEPSERSTEATLAEFVKVEHSIIDHAQRLDIDIGRRTAHLERLKAQRVLLEGDLQRTTSRFSQLTAELVEARRLVRRRVKAMAQLERTAPYQLLFSADDYATYLRQQDALTQLLDADKSRLRDYRSQLERWRLNAADLERRRTNLVNTEDSITYLLRELNWDREEKAALLEAVKQKVHYRNKVARELSDVDAKLVDHVRELAGKYTAGRLWFSSFKGKLPMPVRKGSIVGRFGTRRHPELGTTTRHHGIDIVSEVRNEQGDVPVMVVYPGYVAHAEWLRGLGYTVIIDHTDGYMTLYGHLKAIAAGISVGAHVRTGEVLGSMGDTGSLFGERLYLEVRKDGKAINPAPWFRR